MFHRHDQNYSLERNISNQADELLNFKRQEQIITTSLVSSMLRSLYQKKTVTDITEPKRNVNSTRDATGGKLLKDDCFREQNLSKKYG